MERVSDGQWKGEIVENSEGILDNFAHALICLTRVRSGDSPVFCPALPCPALRGRPPEKGNLNVNVAALWSGAATVLCWAGHRCIQEMRGGRWNRYEIRDTRAGEKITLVEQSFTTTDRETEC